MDHRQPARRQHATSRRLAQVVAFIRRRPAPARQHLNLLGYALIVNAVALHRHAKRRAPNRAA